MPLEVRLIEPPERISFPPTKAEVRLLRKRASHTEGRYVIPIEKGKVNITPPEVTNESYIAESHVHGGMIFVRREHWVERAWETISSMIPGQKNKMPSNVEIISLSGHDIVPMGRRVPHYSNDMPMPSIYMGNTLSPDGYGMEVSRIVMAAIE